MRITVHEFAVIVMILVIVGTVAANLFVPDMPDRGVEGGPETSVTRWH